MFELKRYIKNIAILTSRNSLNESKNNNFLLGKMCSEGQFSYFKLDLSSQSEDSFYIVINISEDMVLQIAKKYLCSVIYGKVVDENDGVIELIIKDLRTSSGNVFRRVVAEQTVFVNTEIVKDFQFEINGEKYILPYNKIIKYLRSPLGKTYEISLNQSGINKTNPSSEINLNNDNIIDEIKEMEDLENELNELQETVFRTAGSTAYNYRCKINCLIKTNNLG